MKSREETLMRRLLKKPAEIGRRMLAMMSSVLLLPPDDEPDYWAFAVWNDPRLAGRGHDDEPPRPAASPRFQA